MSQRSSCPDPWEARREGERAGERGYGSNPYDFGSREPCEEAEEEWRRGYSAGEERRAEEEAEERRAERRAEERREERLEEERREQEYFEAQEPAS